MKVDKHVVAVFLASFVWITICIAIVHIRHVLGEYDENIATHIEKNPKVASARILGSEFDVLSDRFDVEINTISGYRICLHHVHRSCCNWEISIVVINDIRTHGGSGYELRDDEENFYNLSGIIFLGKLLGKNLESVDDIVENAEELYGLFDLFEAHSGKEFVYSERFVIHSNCKRNEPDPDWPV